MNKLTQLLEQLKLEVDSYLEYVGLIQSSSNNFTIDESVLNEYYGEMESLANQISAIFDESNDTDLIGDTDLIEGVSRIAEFFSSLSNDEIVEPEDIGALDLDRFIDMARTHK